MMLLVGASLMIRTLLAIQSGDPGPPSRPRPDAADSILRRSLSRTRIAALRFFRNCFAARRERSGRRGGRASIPGFRRSATGPCRWKIVGAEQKENRPALVDQVNEGYAAAMGVSLVSGRFLTDQEVFGKMHSAVVNEAFARDTSRGTDGIGQHGETSAAQRPALQSRRQLVSDRRRGEEHDQPHPDARDDAGDLHSLHAGGPRRIAFTSLAACRPESLDKARPRAGLCGRSRAARDRG